MRARHGSRPTRARSAATPTPMRTRSATTSACGTPRPTPTTTARSIASTATPRTSWATRPASMRTLNGAHKVQMGWASGARAGGRLAGRHVHRLVARARGRRIAAGGAGAPQHRRSVLPELPHRRRATTPPCPPLDYLNKLNVHRWSGSGNTRYITALGNGQSYSDAASGISIQQMRSTADSATFKVTTTCASQAPTATHQPGQPGRGRDAAGDARVHGDRHQPRQRRLCAAARSRSRAPLPAGWSGRLHDARRSRWRRAPRARPP